MRELASTPAGAAIALRTTETFLEHASPQDPAYLEDLLRALPEAPDERLGSHIASRELRHEAPSVRRAAVAALSSVWGPRANPWFSPLVEDPDDGVRIAALSSLRKHGGLDRELVRRVGRILSNQVPAGAEAKVAAAAALVDTAGPARAAAAETLAQVLAPAAGGFLQRMVTAEIREDDSVIVTMARVLLSIGGPDAARAVQARAAKSGADLRRQLQSLLDGRR
jgi:HEAT repeat protein